MRTGVYRTLLIEDDDLLRTELRAVLNADPRLQVVGEASTFDIALDLIVDVRFDIALIDLTLGTRSGQGLIAPAVMRGKVVVYSVSGDTHAVVQSLTKGADGYIHKGAPPVDMADTLVGVMQGQVPISPTVAGHLLGMLRDPKEPAPNTGSFKLTRREMDVLEGLARGRSYKEVAQQHNISVNTVSYHVKHIYTKMRVSSRGEAVFEAINSGLVQP